jgi:hypothetical protein
VLKTYLTIYISLKNIMDTPPKKPPTTLTHQFPIKCEKSINDNLVEISQSKETHLEIFVHSLAKCFQG